MKARHERGSTRYFDQGVAARLDEIEVNECPYARHDNPFAHKWWMDGWTTADGLTPPLR